MWEERDATMMTMTAMTVEGRAPTTNNNQPKNGWWSGLRGGGAADRGETHQR